MSDWNLIYDAYYSPEQAKLHGSSAYLGIYGSWQEIIATELILEGSDCMPNFEDARLVGQTTLNGWQRQVEYPKYIETWM
jgi:hypothetical protein